MKNCVINQCRPTNGFPLKVHDSSTFEDVVVEGNYDEYAYTPTGACIQIDFEATNTTFRRCTIRNNFAHRWEGNIDGGGILNRATNLRLEECVIANNRITTKDSTDLRYANGSAIWSNYPFYMDNTIICGNIGLYSNGAQGSQIYGAYAGTGNVVNTNCDSTGSVAGACCLETECTLATAYDCGVAGGNFKGMLTTCEQVDCMDDGNYGACCVDGNCASSTQHVCDSLGGEWQGKFTTCENVACTPPPAIAACCLSDDCITTVETLCQTLGGTWQGDSSDCKSATCDPWVGACCVSGSCLEVTLAACYEAEGSYSGDLTVCASTECTDDYCYGDLNGDGVVNVTDVLGIMAAWGACP
jgi:hypothetical protein